MRIKRRTGTGYLAMGGGGGGGGGGGAPTFIITEPQRRADQMLLPGLRFAEPQRRADALRLNQLLLRDQQNRADLARIPSINAVLSESQRRADLARFTVNISATSRSGTPDNDMWGDGWVDATIAQTNTNHGNETPLNISAALTGARRAFIKVDLRKFSGLTAATAGTVGFRMTNVSGLTDATVGWSVTNSGAGNPFTESTLNNANAPTVNAVASGSLTVQANNNNAAKTFSIPQATLTALLGNWALIVFTGDTLAAVTTPSRENATLANRMSLSFTATR